MFTPKNIIQVMNSSGKIGKKEFELRHDEFAELAHDLLKYISDFNKRLKELHNP